MQDPKVLQTTTDYVNGFVYSNGALSFFGSPEGRVVKKGSAFEYQYAIADHQGNTRVVFTSATPTPDAPLATFEGDSGDGALQYTNINPSNVVTFVGANHTAGGSKVVRMNQTYKVGPSKSVKVYPGDKVDIEVWEYHEGASGFGATSTPLTTLVTMVSGAFGGVSGGGGESGLIYSGVNAAINAFVPGGNLGTDRPAAYLNYILFDENYNLLDMGWQPAPDVTFTKQKLSFNTINVKQEGYLFAYLSYDNDSNNWVYFDDFKVTHTPTNVLEYNEYYPFGLQTSNSWTRENNSNDYLYNAGNELNGNSGWYETYFRGYDPVLGRFNQADPLAHASSSHSPYNYAFNDPVFYNDPMGDYPDYVYFESFEQSAGGSMFDSPMESKPWYRVGPGSGNNPMDGYGSVKRNLRVMTRRQFSMFYGIANEYGGVNTDRLNSVGQQAGTPAYWVTTDEGNFIYTDKSYQNLEGWYRAQAFETPQTWYYMEKFQGGSHALVYDPYNRIIYDINHPNNGDTNGLNSWVDGGAKSIGYKFDMNDPAQAAAFWEFGGGRGTLWLSPVTINNPVAVTTFFESQVGKEWDYNLVFNNCKHFAIEGFESGGSNLSTSGPDPSIWLNSSTTLYWNSSMAEPAPVRPIQPNIQTGPWPIMDKR